MKNHTMYPIFCLILVLFLIIGCGGSKYSDVITLNQEYIAMTESYVTDIDKAETSEQVASAMNRYADNLEKIWPQLVALSEKYPELKDINNQPEELKVTQKEAELMGQKLSETFRKVMPFMEDAEVQKAQERIAAIMQG